MGSRVGLRVLQGAMCNPTTRRKCRVCAGEPILYLGESKRLSRWVSMGGAEASLRGITVPVSVLEREMYSLKSAAELLHVPQSTLFYWLEGGERRGRMYRPVLRQEPRGRGAGVTWGEFVEAALLNEYRQRKVPMVELRTFIDRLREEFGVPYPLADRRPLVSGRTLVLEAQEEANLAPDFRLVADVHGQMLLLPPADAFIQRVDWGDDDLAAAWRPHDDGRSPVRCIPGRRGGRPSVGGISTVVLWEHIEAGEDIEDVAQDFDLDVPDVRWALAYENSTRAA